MKRQTKLIILLAVTVTTMLLALTAVQMNLGQRLIVEVAEKRVARNIDIAWQILEMRQQELDLAVGIYAEDPANIDTWRRDQQIDILKNVDPEQIEEGTVAGAVVRQFPPKAGKTSRGFISLGKGDLTNEDKPLVERCHINGKLSPTLAIFSARQTKNDSVIVAAQVLTRADALLWRVQRGLFGDASFEGKRTGTVTIFAGTMRTSTTVLKRNNSSAVGTLVSDEVAQRVLEQKKSWTDPALVVDAWYMSRYDPIFDPAHRVVGILYIGELQAALLDRAHEITILGTLSIVAVLALALLGWLLVVFFERRAKTQRNQVRFEFLRVLGHELKAPINAVEGYLQIIEEESLGPVPEPYIPMVKRSVLRIGHMRKLIADMLDLTRIEAGEKHRNIDDNIDMVEVLKESVETVQPMADNRGITINLTAPDKLEMRADRGELSIICNNLLTNAVKYNKNEGKVMISLAVEHNGIRLVVQDTGIGMTEQDRAKLFGEFVRIRNDKTRNIHGSGLGLNILQKVVALYNGNIQVESQEDIGSTFTVVLP